MLDLLNFLIYNIIMENTKPYLTQYCNLVFELHNKGITYDYAPNNQKKELRELLEKAAEQSGLDEDEVVHICICREYEIFRKVNTYARILKLAVECNS